MLENSSGIPATNPILENLFGQALANQGVLTQ